MTQLPTRRRSFLAALAALVAAPAALAGRWGYAGRVVSVTPESWWAGAVPGVAFEVEGTPRMQALYEYLGKLHRHLHAAGVEIPKDLSGNDAIVLEWNNRNVDTPCGRLWDADGNEVLEDCIYANLKTGEVRWHKTLPGGGKHDFAYGRRPVFLDGKFVLEDFIHEEVKLYPAPLKFKATHSG